MNEKNEKKINKEVIKDLVICKPLGQLTSDDISKLNTYEFTLIKDVNKKLNRTSYKWETTLLGIKISDYLDEVQYKLILMDKGIIEEKPRIICKAYVRCTYGNTSSDRMYYSMQVLFTKTIRVVHFIKDLQKLYLDRICERDHINLNWEFSSPISDDVISQSDTVVGF